jgi:histidyl-tRNA synthetase
VAILGDEELTRGEVTLKDLRTSEQTRVAASALGEALRKDT